LIRVIIIFFTWMAVQFHCFSSSFYPANKRRWLPLAYGSIALNITLAIFKIIPQKVVLEGNILLPKYGWTIFIIAIPLLMLAARNIYVFWPRLKNQNNPVVYNQTVSLVLCLGVLVIFLLSAILPFTHDFPIAHLGNIIVALILSYAVVGHQLVDIRYVLRRGFIWASIFICGIATFWTALLIFHEIMNIELSLMSLFSATVAGIIAAVVIFKVRDIITQFVGRAFQGASYNYREKLNEFANKIHNVFSLKEQGAELLKLTVRAVGCSKAGLLFRDSNGNYETQLTESGDSIGALSYFTLKGDNPVIEYIKRERHPLTRENLAILPEFLSLWQQEKESIEINGIDLFMPLISRDRLIGLLVLDKKKAGHYTLEDYTLLETITNKVAVSMEKEYLREQLKEREQELSVINRSNAIISSSLDIQRIYDNFIKELKNVVDVDWAAIGVIEDSEIHFMAIFTEIGSPWKVGERIPIKGSATEWVVAHHKTLIESDLTVENRFSMGKYHLQQSLRTIAFMPLIISNQVIGALSVGSRKPDAYNTRHIKLLEQLASQISMPIENARLYAKSEHMARVDSLTGLLNRRSLDEILPSEIGRHSRYGGVFSLMVLDLDSFKALNDNYGHLAGDELLRQVGIIMSNAIRESDRAFRYGGDEFAILLPQTTIEAATKVAERIRQQTYAMMEIGTKPISVSLGLASWPADGVVANDIIAAADVALYQAKRAGGNRTQCSVIKFNSAAKDAARSNETHDSNALSAIFAMAATVDTRDRFTQNHSKRVHEFSIAIGNGLGMKPLELNLLGTCALLHDIGKVGISDEILNKQEVLSENEWETIKSHPMLGAAIVSHSTQLKPCIAGILHHHEKYDGTGYPDALKGEEIPLESRILAIADAFAAMTSERVYSKELTYEVAISEIKSGAGVQFDPKLVKIFVEVIPHTIASPDQSRISIE
jgi:diguanylate cyclase (GGDEF)-like protein